jgi:hypothetical protein
VIFLNEPMRAMMQRLKENGSAHVFLNTEGEPVDEEPVAAAGVADQDEAGTGGRRVCLPVPARVRHPRRAFGCGRPDRGRTHGAQQPGDGIEGVRSPRRPAPAPEGGGRQNHVPQAVASRRGSSSEKGEAGTARDEADGAADGPGGDRRRLPEGPRVRRPDGLSHARGAGVVSSARSGRCWPRSRGPGSTSTRSATTPARTCSSSW